MKYHFLFLFSLLNCFLILFLWIRVDTQTKVRSSSIQTYVKNLFRNVVVFLSHHPLPRPVSSSSRLILFLYIQKEKFLFYLFSVILPIFGYINIPCGTLPFPRIRMTWESKTNGATITFWMSFSTDLSVANQETIFDFPFICF